ncbi:MAG: hypothetical protein HC889_16445 [Synechococcaceae cyanobacterium SM1_2_3]|nr:hypothetical protein [Synechococcaceae cyanobacterium SM1_2_3]
MCLLHSPPPPATASAKTAAAGPLKILGSFGSPDARAVIPIHSGLLAGFRPRPVFLLALFPTLIRPAMDVAIPTGKHIIFAQVRGFGALFGPSGPGAGGTLLRTLRRWTTQPVVRCAA